MNRYLFVLFFSVCFTFFAISQQKLSGFLFEDFQDATVHFVGGALSNEKVNYNMLDKSLYFVDKSDDMIKIVSDIDRIGFIRISERHFIPTQNGMQEVLKTTPVIYVEYFAKGRIKPQKGGFGATGVASINTYTDFRSGGQYTLKEHEIEVSGYYNSYWIELNGKKRKFDDFKQFLKIYSKHKIVLDKHIKDNNIEFNDVDEIVNLCLYAESLK